MTRFAQWAVGTEGSSRSSALIRIGLVLLIWSRYAGLLLLYKDMSPSGLTLSIGFFLFTAMMFLGLWSRFSTAGTAIVLLLMYYYFGFELNRQAWTHHHNYLLLIATCLTVLTPCDRSYSLDRWLSLKRSEKAGTAPPPERGNLWGLHLIALQLSLIYFWTAADKTNWAFLSGDRMEHYLMWYYLGSDYPSWPGFHFLMVLTSWITVALEYALAGGMLFQRSRKYLIWPGILLHATFYVLLPVRTYSLTMLLLYLAYLNADHVHRTLDYLSGWNLENKVRIP
jgi:hypothetical protein